MLSALASTFKGKSKRKTKDRSPEAAQSTQPSKKQSFSLLQALPSISSVNMPPSEIGAPSLTTTPSFISVNSYESGSSVNFLADHLRLQLNASREDLRVERERYARREEQQAELIDAQRQHYEARIRDLENNARGAGPSRRRWMKRGHIWYALVLL